MICASGLLATLCKAFIVTFFRRLCPLPANACRYKELITRDGTKKGMMISNSVQQFRKSFSHVLNIIFSLLICSSLNGSFTLRLQFCV